MTREEAIVNLWHLSRMGLANSPTVPSRYDRMIWVRDNMKLHHPDLCRVSLENRDLTAKELWGEITDILSETK